MAGRGRGRAGLAGALALGLGAGGLLAGEAAPLGPGDREAWDEVAAALQVERLAEPALEAWTVGRGRQDMASRRRAFLAALDESPHRELYRRAADGYGVRSLRGREQLVSGMTLLVSGARRGVDRLTYLGVTAHERVDRAELRALLDQAVRLRPGVLAEALRVWRMPEVEVGWALLYRAIFGPGWSEQPEDPKLRRAKRVVELALRTGGSGVEREMRGALGE